MEKQIHKFSQPDETWAIWDIKSHEDFLSRFMVKGRFHKNVPEEISKEYEIVERLIYYSFYCYPLIDEAFSKATRLFEAGVKIRLNQLAITCNGKYESLKSKLEKLGKHTSVDFYKEWDKAREVRNIFAHPEAGRLMGITVYRSFLQMVNILNTLFLDKEIVESNENHLIKLKKQTEKFKRKLFILELDSKRFLVWSIIPYSFFGTGNKAKSFWFFHPVLTSFPQTTDKINFDIPIFLRLTDVKITDSGIRGTDLISKRVVKAYKTMDAANFKLYETHKLLRSSSDIAVKNLYLKFIEEELAYEIVKFLYFECWD
ncbi:hypothetical protein PbJCM13498_41010 [Prolixibacter bellariivorans]|uniref:Uncharacterized protein n=1 Tax=Prolixibacter bellariivorans TaxID=314319 RepID=A0A5M4B5Y3_9BACT|nr:hypothetical protein [Prolixibacter bellariivorans]GET35238.1 hypothetical protein PbJCM13498_41010 [Prolixibacter bellariivorans]